MKMKINSLLIVLFTVLILVSMATAYPIMNVGKAPVMRRNWFNNLKIVKTIKSIKEKQNEKQKQFDDLLNAAN